MYFTFIDEEIKVLTPSNPYRVEGMVRRDDGWKIVHIHVSATP